MPRADAHLTSDFDTLKNDDSLTGTVTVPASQVIGASTTATYETTVTVGAPESLLVGSVTNNVSYPSGHYLSLSGAFRFNRTGSAPYSIIVRSYHSGGSSVRLICSIFNDGASALTTSATADVFTFRIKTVKVPRFQ